MDQSKTLQRVRRLGIFWLFVSLGTLALFSIFADVINGSAYHYTGTYDSGFFRYLTYILIGHTVAFASIAVFILVKLRSTVMSRRFFIFIVAMAISVTCVQLLMRQASGSFTDCFYSCVDTVFPLHLNQIVTFITAYVLAAELALFITLLSFLAIRGKLFSKILVLLPVGALIVVLTGLGIYIATLPKIVYFTGTVTSAEVGCSNTAQPATIFVDGKKILIENAYSTRSAGKVGNNRLYSCSEEGQLISHAGQLGDPEDTYALYSGKKSLSSALLGQEIKFLGQEIGTDTYTITGSEGYSIGIR